jgi:hypothetical protein
MQVQRPGTICTEAHAASCFSHRASEKESPNLELELDVTEPSEEEHMIKTEVATARPKETPTASQQALHEVIAVRAHQMFLERGGQHGHDVEDWLKAELEIRRNGAPRTLKP